MRQPKRRAERYSRKTYDFRRAIGIANYLTSVAGGGLTLPRADLIWYATSGVDTIGLSPNALWDALPSYMRSIYLTDRDTKKSDATILANIQASGFLNVGGGLHGNATKGYAQYSAAATAETNDRAADYYREDYGFPTDIKSLVIASGGAVEAAIGPAATISLAAGQFAVRPWVVSSTGSPVGDEGYVAQPALTNLFGSSDSPAAARTKTLTAQKYCLQVKTGSATCSYGTATPSSPLQFTATAGDTTFTPTGVDDWCLTASGGYVFMAIPYGQSTVSTVGTTGGNGVSIPLTGSADADALKDCFEGPNGNDAVGTVAVLMKVMVRMSDLTAFVNHSILSTGADFGSLYISKTSTPSMRTKSYDFTTVSEVNVVDQNSGEYNIKVVEYNGTKFRVGNRRYNGDGSAIDASIVWSHATLAGGSTFDGSFNPTSFLRWFLNIAIPGNMRCHFVSNQPGLGDTEIIRRLREYGQF